MRLLIRICILGCLMFCSYLNAQNKSDLGKIVFGVHCGNEANKETQLVFERIKDKLVQVIVDSGYSSLTTYRFYLSPNVSITDVKRAEGGMRDVYVVKGYLNLTIQDKNTIYASQTINFNGKGNDYNTALLDGINSLNLGIVKQILNDAEDKILEFYSSNKKSIICHAELLCSENKYDEAITTLFMIPESTIELYQEATKLAVDIYKKKILYENVQDSIARSKTNEVILTKANSFLIMSDPIAAAKTLWDYRPTSDIQMREYERILAEAKLQVKAQELIDLSREEQAHRERMQKEKNRIELSRRGFQLQSQYIEAAKEVACTYLKTNNSFQFYIYK